MVRTHSSDLPASSTGYFLIAVYLGRMKSAIIVILAVAVIGIGGYVLYSQNQSANETGATDNSTSSDSSISSGQTLDLSNRGLTEVGSEIYNKTDTVVLILSNNNLKSLKSEMGKMTKVEVLKLNHNLLEGSLIAEIRKMPLKELDASNNNLTGVPAEIGQLSKLKTLDFSNNKITGLPNELANLQDTLKIFNLSGNPISQETINRLKASLPNTEIIF